MLMFTTGYDVEGPVMNYCQANGTWLYKESTNCTLQSCPPPEGIHNGYWISSHSRDTVRYNNETLTLFNSSVLETGLYVGKVLSLVCIQGYTPSIPLYSITCLPTLLWNISTPLVACDPIQCPVLEIINGVVIGNFTSFNSIVSVSCDEGYSLDATSNSVLRCTAGGVWNMKTPRCIAVSCGEPQAIVNGSVTAENFMYNSTARYGCDEGLTLVGDKKMTCSSSGVWVSERQPRCLLVSCQHPGSVSHGHVYASNSPVSSNSLDTQTVSIYHESLLLLFLQILTMPFICF